MTNYKGFKRGDRVTVKMTDKAYDDYGTIDPGMIGTIASFPPKVCIVQGAIYDGLPYFAYVVFDKIKTIGTHSNPYRAGIDICNLQKE
jgi:hypothetical protein